MYRFHRGGEEWRKYTTDLLKHFEINGRKCWKIEPVLDTKNAKAKNKKNNRLLECIDVYEDEHQMFYDALSKLMEVRRNTKTTTNALFLQCLDEWEVCTFTVCSICS